MNRAVFLDRDGTINQDVGYPRSFQELSIYPESVEAVRRLNQAGLLVVILTNQSGVGRGFVTEESLQAMHRQLQGFFLQNGARIDGVYYCPHWKESPDPRYGLACDCRKPATGLALRAAQDFSLDLNRCFMVGDKLEDILCGHRVGARSVLVLTGAGAKAVETLSWLRENCRTGAKTELPAGAPGKILSVNKRQPFIFSEFNDEREKAVSSENGLFEVALLEPDFIAPGILEAVDWVLAHL